MKQTVLVIVIVIVLANVPPVKWLVGHEDVYTVMLPGHLPLMKSITPAGILNSLCVTGRLINRWSERIQHHYTELHPKIFLNFGGGAIT